MFKSIQSEQDIKEFLAQTNYLHDGYLLAVQYANNGISVNKDEYSFDFEKTKLILRIMVTSIFDTVIEIEFEGLSEWQIRDDQRDILNTAVFFDESHRIVWTDDTYINLEYLKNTSYVIAQSMKWRTAE